MTVGELIVKISADTAELFKGFGEAADKASMFGSVLSGSLASAAIQKGISAVTKGIKEIGIGSIETGMEFDKAMSQVAATMGKTTGEITELRDFAQEMGETTAFSATQAAEALNYMALAGYDTNESMQMLPNVLNLAAAGAMDLGLASDMLTDAQTALGMSFERTGQMTDEMAKTASTTNTSVTQLGEAILRIGGLAQSMGGGMIQMADGTTRAYDNVTELNQVLGILADNGIKGSEAGTHLRNILLKLGSDASTKEMMHSLGVEIFDTEGNMRSMRDVMTELGTAMEGMTSEQKLEAFAEMFNVRDVSAMNALLGTTAERWDEVGLAILDSAGAAEQMANTQLDNLAGDITLMKSAFEGLKIAISDTAAPALREFVQEGTKGIQRIAEAVRNGGIAAGFSELSNVIGEAVSNISERMHDVADAIRNFDFSSAVRDAMTNIKTAFSSGSVREFVDAGLDMMVSLAEAFAKAAPEIGAALPGILAEIASWFISHVGDFLKIGVAIVQGIATAIAQAVIHLPEALVDVIGGVADAIYGFFGKDRKDSAKHSQEIKESFKQTVGGALTEAGDELGETARQTGHTIITQFDEALGQDVQYVRNSLGELVNVNSEEGKRIIASWEETANGMSDAIGSGVDRTSEHLTRAEERLSGYGSTMSGLMQSAMEMTNAAVEAGMSRQVELVDGGMMNVTSRMQEAYGIMASVAMEGGNTVVDTTEEYTRRMAEVAGLNYEEMEGTTSEKMAAIEETISTGMLNGSMEAETALKEMNNILAVNWEEIKAAAETAFGEGGIASTILAAWVRIQEDITTYWTQITEDLRNTWATINTDAETAFAQMGSGITAAFNTVNSAVQAGINLIRNTMVNGWNTIRQATQTSWNTILQAVTTAMNTMQSNVKTGMNSIAQVIQTAWKTVQTQTTSTWNAIKTLLTSTLNAIKTLFTQQFNFIRQTIQQTWQNVLQVTQQVWTEIRDFLQQTVEEIKAIFLEPNWQEVGEMIIEGIREGVLAKAGELAEAAAQVVREALAAAKAAAEIASPSKKFRREVGEQITLGIALGISDRKKDVTKSIEDVLKTAHNTATRLAGRMADRIKQLETTLSKENLVHEKYLLEQEQAAYEKSIEDKYKEIEKLELDSIEKREEAKKKKEGGELKERLAEIEKEEIEKRESINEQIAEMEQNWLQKQADRQREAARERLQVHIDALTELKDEYDKRLSEIEDREGDFIEKMQDYGKLFRMVKDADTKEENFVLEDLNEQISALEKYGNLLQNLKSKGTPESLISEVLSMDIDNAISYMQELEKMTDSQFDDYIASWQAKEELAAEIAKNFYADQYKALNEEFLQKVTDGVADLDTSMWIIGQQAVIGLEEGMNAGLPNLLSSASRIANALVDEMKKALTIHSPSRRMHDEVGLNVTEGVAEGMVDGISEIEDAADDIVDAISVDPSQLRQMFIKAWNDSSNGFLAIWSKGWKDLFVICTEAGRELIELIREIVKEVEDVFLKNDWRSVGLAITDGVRKGIEAGRSSLINAAVSAAVAALAAAKSALGISSPSKVFRDEVGLQISKGIALGISDGIGEVEEALGNINSLTDSIRFDEIDFENGDGLNNRGFTQINNIYSPETLDPSEVARQTRWQTQEMVLALNRG